jgi:hypothetical protein
MFANNGIKANANAEEIGQHLRSRENVVVSIFKTIICKVNVLS